MTSHTPGPWQVVPADQAVTPWIVGDKDGGSIADCSPPGPWMKKAQAAANARLIAAAPVMLAALKELAKLGREGMKPNYREWLTFHDKVALIAESAIDSATVTESGAAPAKALS